MTKMLLINSCAECPKAGRCSVLGTKSQRVAFFIGIGMPDIHPKCSLESAPQKTAEQNDHNAQQLKAEIAELADKYSTGRYDNYLYPFENIIVELRQLSAS